MQEQKRCSKVNDNQCYYLNEVSFDGKGRNKESRGVCEKIKCSACFGVQGRIWFSFKVANQAAVAGQHWCRLQEPPWSRSRWAVCPYWALCRSASSSWGMFGCFLTPLSCSEVQIYLQTHQKSDLQRSIAVSMVLVEERSLLVLQLLLFEGCFLVTWITFRRPRLWISTGAIKHRGVPVAQVLGLAQQPLEAVWQTSTKCFVWAAN